MHPIGRRVGQVVQKVLTDFARPDDRLLVLDAVLRQAPATPATRFTGVEARSSWSDATFPIIQSLFLPKLPHVLPQVPAPVC